MIGEGPAAGDVQDEARQHAASGGRRRAQVRTNVPRLLQQALLSVSTSSSGRPHSAAAAVTSDSLGAVHRSAACPAT